MNYGNKIFVYEGIPDIYFSAFLSTDLMSGVTLRRYLLPDITDNGNFKGSFFFLLLMMRWIPPHTHTHTPLPGKGNEGISTRCAHAPWMDVLGCLLVSAHLITQLLLSFSAGHLWLTDSGLVLNCQPCLHLHESYTPLPG